MKSCPLFELHALTRTFSEGKNTVAVLKGVTLQLHQNQLTAICGPSGAGKSTLLHILGLLDRSFEGTLCLLGEDLTQLTEQASTRYRLERIGFVFQRYHVIDAMTVLENVAWPHWRLYRDRKRAFDRARALLDDFGLAERANYHPAKLSGGEMQRVALARALVNSPAVVLADEPTAQLDETNAKHIIDSLHNLAAQGHSVVVVTHDPNLARAADSVVNMSYGRVTCMNREPDAALA